MEGEVEKEKGDEEWTKSREEARRKDEEKTDKNRKRREKRNAAKKKSNEKNGSGGGNNNNNNNKSEGMAVDGGAHTTGEVHNAAAADGVPQSEEAGVIIHED